MRAVQIDWRTALVFVTREPSWTERIAVGGLVLLLAPPAGWVLALGYGRLVGTRLVEGGTPLLPPWRGHVGSALRGGAKSAGVILAYFAPFLLAYWLLGATPGDILRHRQEVAQFAGALAVFPPLALPLLPVLYAARYGWMHFSPADNLILLVLFAGAVLLLPAAFLQIALHRRFRAAIHVGSAIRMALAVPRLYAEAWVVSLAVSAASVLVLPLAPWLLFWSYLVISHVFLQVLARADRSAPAPLRAPQLQQVPT
jgi:Protein of unknown function (DUF4013)